MKESTQMVGRPRSSLNGEFKGENPYSSSIPLIVRPKDNLSRPKTRDEKLYCWYYWIDKILDPNQTRYVLDTLIRLPLFEAEWGASTGKGKELEDKTETFINEEGGL